MRNAFLLIDSANSHAENIRNTKVHPRGHKETEDQPSNIGKEPQHIVQGLQEHNKIAFGDTQKTTEYHRPARVYNRTAWQETRQERKTQTQRIQPLPEREDDARNEHDRCGQSMEGKRKLHIDRLFNATNGPRLAVTDTTILTIPLLSGGLMRGYISPSYRQTHFLESRSIPVICEIKNRLLLFRSF